MVIMRPFRGLRPTNEMAEAVASPPYDVLDSDEARVIVQKNPNSFLRVVKPEVDLPPSLDVHADEVYDQGAQNLARLETDGVMVQDELPMFYIYKQVMGEHQQYGLVGCVAATDYENDRIKKHEFTRPDKENDRIRHIQTQNAQCGPVFLTYHDDEAFNTLQEKICANTPAVDFVAEDGIGHTLWVVDAAADIQSIQNIFGGVDHLYVADGHHRSASGTIIAQRKREENPDHTGNEEYNYFLAVSFPKSHMLIQPYNRAVEDLNGLSPQEFLAKVGEKFEISESANPSPQSLKHISMYLNGKWLGLTPIAGSYPVDDPVKSIDASILQENLLSPVLGIHDPRTDNRIKFVGGIRGTQELEKLVNSGKFQVAFSMYPVSMDQLMAVADSGNVMPPKCTWFEPKLRSGMVVHKL